MTATQSKEFKQLPFPDNLLKINGSKLNELQKQIAAEKCVLAFITDEVKKADAVLTLDEQPVRILTQDGIDQLKKKFMHYLNRLVNLEKANKLAAINGKGYKISKFFREKFSNLIRIISEKTQQFNTSQPASTDKKASQFTDVKDVKDVKAQETTESDEGTVSDESNLDKRARDQTSTKLIDWILNESDKFKTSAIYTALKQNSAYDRDALNPVSALLGYFTQPITDVVENDVLNKDDKDVKDNDVIDFKNMPLILRLHILLQVAIGLQQQLEAKQLQQQSETKQDEQPHLSRIQVFLVENWQKHWENFLVENWQKHWEKMIKNGMQIVELKNTEAKEKNDVIHNTLRGSLEHFKKFPEDFYAFNFGLLAFEILSGINFDTCDPSDQARLIGQLRPNDKYAKKCGIFNTITPQPIHDLIFACLKNPTAEKLPDIPTICETLMGGIELVHHKQNQLEFKDKNRESGVERLIERYPTMFLHAQLGVTNIMKEEMHRESYPVEVKAIYFPSENLTETERLIFRTDLQEFSHVSVSELEDKRIMFYSQDHITQSEIEYIYSRIEDLQKKHQDKPGLNVLKNW